MNVDLLSGLLQKLLVDHDCVSLGKLGSFICINEGATFTQQGYTLLPPQRKIVFREQQTEDTLLRDALSEEHALSIQDAEEIIVTFLEELRDHLSRKKVVELPDFGLLRATKENNFFFVPFEGNIVDKENFALEPLSLKVTIPVVEEDPEPQQPIEPQATAPEQPAAPEQSAQPAEPLAPQPAPEQPAEPLDPQPAPAAPAAPAQSAAPQPEQPASPRRRLTPLRLTLIVLAAVLVLIVAGFFILAYGFPDVMDRLLYTPEELEILHQLY